jgi:hypothetical protein
MNELLQIHTKRGMNLFDIFVTQFAGEDSFFFNLDDAFRREDLLFLFNELIKVPFDAEKIPIDATGTSLISGGLKEAFKEEDYDKVKVFFTQTRISLQTHILAQKTIFKRMGSDFESFFGLRSINFSDLKWAEFFSRKVIPGCF